MQVLELSVGTEQDPDADYATAYLYDGSGRLERITGPGLLGYVVKYSRLANSGLVQTVAYMSDADTTLAYTTRGYMADRETRAK